MELKQIFYVYLFMTYVICLKLYQIIKYHFPEICTHFDDITGTILLYFYQTTRAFRKYVFESSLSLN